MYTHSPLLVYLVTTIEVTAIAVILLAANFTITDAQQELSTSQPPVTQNRITLLQSMNDSFRVQVPEGGVIQDVDNTGSALLEEVT